MAIATLHDTAGRSGKGKYISLFLAIVAILIIILIVLFVRGVVSIANKNEATPVQQTPETTAPGTTRSTGAPTNNTDTQSDRTVPSSSGGNGDTIMNAAQ